jgi:hypothetical protein
MERSDAVVLLAGTAEIVGVSPVSEENLDELYVTKGHSHVQGSVALRVVGVDGAAELQQLLPCTQTKGSQQMNKSRPSLRD